MRRRSGKRREGIWKSGKSKNVADQDIRFDYVESGSLLGGKYKEVKSYPVGYETIIQMYPLGLLDSAKG